MTTSVIRTYLYTDGAATSLAPADAHSAAMAVLAEVSSHRTIVEHDIYTEWASSDLDMAIFSRMYPEFVFAVEWRNGEQSQCLEYWHLGQRQQLNPIVTYPQFNAGKLEAGPLSVTLTVRDGLIEHWFGLPDNADVTVLDFDASDYLLRILKDRQRHTICLTCLAEEVDLLDGGAVIDRHFDGICDRCGDEYSAV